MFKGKTVGDYQITNVTGEGAYSQVYWGNHIPTGTQVAIKAINLKEVQGEEKNQFYRELLGLNESIEHPNIVTLYDIAIQDDYLLLFMEYYRGGSLYEKMRRFGKFSIVQARKHFIELLSAVSFLHSRHIVHCDIKLQNVLLGVNGAAHLIDFGFCNSFDTPITTRAGTPGFEAPEMIPQSPEMPIQYGKEVDIFALGVCLYTMVSGRMPFDAQDTDQALLIKQINELQIPDYVPTNLAELIRSMLSLEPTKRPTLSQIVQHSWIHDSGVNMNNFTYENSPSLISRNRELIDNFVSVVQNLRRPSTSASPEMMKTLKDQGFDEEKVAKALGEGLFGKEFAAYLVQKTIDDNLKYTQSMKNRVSSEIERFLSRI